MSWVYVLLGYTWNASIVFTHIVQAWATSSFSLGSEFVPLTYPIISSCIAFLPFRHSRRSGPTFCVPVLAGQSYKMLAGSSDSRSDSDSKANRVRVGLSLCLRSSRASTWRRSPRNQGKKYPEKAHRSLPSDGIAPSHVFINRCVLKIICDHSLPWKAVLIINSFLDYFLPFPSLLSP